MASGNTMGSGDDDPSLTTSISGAGGMNAGQSLIARIMLAIVDVQVAVAGFPCRRLVAQARVKGRIIEKIVCHVYLVKVFT